MRAPNPSRSDHVANDAVGSVDVKELKTYQQLFLYFVPMLTNLGFVNIIVVVVRLIWFKKYLNEAGESKTKESQKDVFVDFALAAPALLRARNPENREDVELAPSKPFNPSSGLTSSIDISNPKPEKPITSSNPTDLLATTHDPSLTHTTTSEKPEATTLLDDKPARITFDPSLKPPARTQSGALYIPNPRDRDQGSSTPVLSSASLVRVSRLKFSPS